MRIIYRFITFFIVLVFLVNLSACDKKKEPEKEIVRPIKSMVIKEPRDTVVRRFPGKVIADKEAKLSFNVEGQLKKLPILEGDIVKKGQMIAGLDPKKYQEKANETKAKLIKDEAQFRRAQKLIKDGFISESDYDTTRSNYLSAKATYETAKRDLRDTRIYAPFSGVIAVKHVDNFEYVTAKQTICNLHELEAINIEINVPENIIISLKHDREYRGNQDKDNYYAIFEAAPQHKYKLKVKEYSSLADPDTQTYRVVFKLPRPKEINVLPGMTSTVYAEIDDFKAPKSGYYVVPVSAVFEDENQKPSVWLIDPNTNKVQRRQVTVKQLTGNEIQILSGVKTR